MMVWEVARKQAQPESLSVVGRAAPGPPGGALALSLPASPAFLLGLAAGSISRVQLWCPILMVRRWLGQWSFLEENITRSENILFAVSTVVAVDSQLCF